MTRPLEVFGLDLSITAAGFAPEESVCETVGGSAPEGDRRLITIRNRIRYWLRRHAYDLAVLEGPGFNSTRIFGVAMVHGVVRAELVAAGVPYAIVAPSTLHGFGTGSGAATKTEMKQAAAGMAGRKFHDDNQADAWLLRRMGCAALGDLGGLTPDQIGWLGHVQSWPHPVDPYDTFVEVGQVAKCRHDVWCLRNGDHWLHPFTLDRCDKPPK